MFKKKPETETPTESLLKALTAALQSNVPPDGEAFQECLARASLALLDHYVLEDSLLSLELEKLVTAFSNRKDPFVNSLGLMEHAAARAMLNALRVRRKQRRVAQGKEG